MRLMEAIRLRVRDINFDYRQITVRSGKGGKDRVTVLPDSLMNPLKIHLSRVRTLHKSDLVEGYGRVYLPMRSIESTRMPTANGDGPLSRIHAPAAFESPCLAQYVFPSQQRSEDPRSKEIRRH
jgi:integrase